MGKETCSIKGTWPKIEQVCPLVRVTFPFSATLLYISVRNIILHASCSRGFNEAVNGFTDEGWSMIESDGIDDVTVLVNSSPSKLMGANFSYTNGFSPVSSAVLCAKASMLLQVRRL